MTPELSLLSCLLSHDLFVKYYEYVDIKSIKDTCKEIGYLFTVLEDLQEKHPSPSLDDLRAYFYVKYPDADRSLYDGLFNQLSEASLSEGLPEVLLEEIKRRKVALKLSERAFQFSQGNSSSEELANLYDQLKPDSLQSDRTSIKRVTNRLGELLDHSFKDQGIRWRLNCLNKSLGSLREGDFGFIFARPETGKTTFLASEITHALKQVQRPIIWLNNEEQGEKVMLRIYQAYFKATLPTLMANPGYYEERFLSETKGLLEFYDESQLDKKEIEAIVNEKHPSLVVYDQLPKIKGFAADRDDLRLGAIFQWARELAKNSHAAIGVSQADGTAEGVRYLTMEHVANAKTAIQAEADWILGLGKVHDQTLEYVRYLNISKNKLFGDKDSDPSLRHGKFEVLIEPTVARYEDIVDYQ